MPTTDELQQQIEALTQRVDAITAPPTDYYVHQYSGEEIDDAVAKISGSTGLVSSFNGRTGAVMPAAGDYTAAMVGAAPEGYGLGESIGKPITDCNDATAGGWYRLGEGSLNTPELIPNYAYASLLVVPRGTDVTQLYYNPIGICYMAVRIKSNSGWEPWEYINPPMSLGVEYRTVERYLGNPVYVKLVNVGAAPNNSEKQVSMGVSNLKQIIRYSASFANGDALPYENSTNNSHARVALVSKNGTGIIRITTDYDFSASSIYGLVAYTKTTD